MRSIMWFSISSTDKDFCCQISDIGLNLGFIKNKIKIKIKVFV